MGLTNTPDLLPGTLDLLILRTLNGGALHGYGIAQRLKIVSGDVLQIGESALYPALQRQLAGGFVKAAWGASENNRKARFYTMTAAGRRRLQAERAAYERMSAAIARVLQTA
jgi:PadR family transcriptional regulator, regulatory protein PadR